MPTTSPQICARTGCNKSIYIETGGFKHPYCGRTCATNIISKSNACFNPNCTRQKYIGPNNVQFDYCGRSCARQHLSSNALSAPTCSRTSCPKRVYTDPQNKAKFHAFCSKNCYWLECSTLTNTKLSLLNANDLDHIWAHQRFISMLPQAKIKGIFRLQMPKNLVDAHQNLKKQIATQNNLPLNRVTHKMFHGTKHSCDPLQYINRPSPVCSSNCGLCGIVSKGNVSTFSKYNGQMWFANNASISLGYCNGGTTNAIFMVDVLAPTANSILIVSQNAATLPRFMVVFQ
ncbi:14357_t:CDS:2 [Funneliformis mosseae]|uniref:14357_t:CDS:1 n=1 Tax=Funneliformis mosseae TaxID=27381 RepID=A0A9N8VAY9_FUNMO|nr:14357_t:CDS:2 [Funneliformis mosseae]